MRLLKSFFILASIVWLTACASLYQPKEGEPTAKLNLKGMVAGGNPNKRIRYDGNPSKLTADENGYALIPAAKRITVYADISGHNFSCEDSKTFVPVPGKSYYPEFEMITNRCRLNIYREDATKESGLDFEPTLKARIPGERC